MRSTKIALLAILASAVPVAAASAQMRPQETTCTSSLIQDEVPCQIGRDMPTDIVRSSNLPRLQSSIFQAGEPSVLLRTNVGTHRDAPTPEIVKSDTDRAAVSTYISDLDDASARTLIAGLDLDHEEIVLPDCLMFRLIERNAYVVFMPFNAEFDAYSRCGRAVHDRLIRIIEA